MKPLKQSVLRQVTVWSLTLALLWPVGTQFWLPLRAKASSYLHGTQALGQGTWDQAANQAFPKDEQPRSSEDLEVNGEGGEGIDDSSKGDGLLSKYPWGIQVPWVGVSGFWSRIGEKNLGIPPAKYLLYHTIRIPS